MIRVNIKTQTNIISLPDDFAVLKDISSDGNYVYAIKYSADVVKAINNNSIIVKIKVSNVPFAQSAPTALSSLRAGQIVNGLLLDTSRRRDSIRSFEAVLVKTITSDISKKIPNNKIKTVLSSGNLQRANRRSIMAKTAFGDTQKLPLFQTRDLTLFNTDKLSDGNIAYPVHQTHLYKNNDFFEKTNSTQAKQLSENLLFDQGIDPAQALSSLNLIASTKRQIGGVITKTNFLSKNKELNARQTVSESSLLVESVLGSEEFSPPTHHLQLPKASQLNVSTIKQTNFIGIEETLSLPLNSIGDTFYLSFQLYDSSGNEVDSAEGTVAHARNLALFTIPRKAPKVSYRLSAAAGTNVLTITQQDVNAAGVYVYRKVFLRNTAEVSANYDLVAKIPLRVSDGSTTITDNVSNFNPTVYRIIPYNQFGLRGGIFASAVVRSTRLPAGHRVPIKRRKAFISISHSTLSNGLRIELNDIPAGPSSIQLYRRDLTANQATKFLVGDPVILRAHGDNTTIYIKDLFTLPNRIYEYSVELRYPDGTNVFCPNILVVEYNPATSSIISTIVSPPKVVRKGVDIDVQFDLTSSIVLGKIDLVKQALQQQGILGFFQNDIANNRNNLQNLIAYNVIRTDLTTGDIEDFGVIIDTHFSDRSFGPVKNVTPLQELHEYRYHIITHLRSPETLIPTFTRQVQNQTNPNLSYTLTPSKWYHPVVLTEGNIVTDTSLKRNWSKTDFTHGTVGNVVETTISLNSGMPTLTDGIAKPVSNDAILIEWRTQGNIKLIDHFIVILEILGMQTILGAVHNITDTNASQFVHEYDEKEHAEFLFYIIPVYYDFTRGHAIKTNKVIT